jgi:hypothetical protein
MDAVELPVPPGGVRPGHLGLIASGRVILGDIAATAVDLSLRGWLEIESSGDGDGGWMLASAEPPQGSQEPAEYERVLLGRLARPGYPAALASVAADLPAGLAQVREELVRDAVHRGWLHRLHHHDRTAAGEELARQLTAFRQDLRAAKAGSPEATARTSSTWASSAGTGPDHHRKGGKVVTIPLASRTARAIDLAIGERTEGPVFLAADGKRLDRHAAGRVVRAGIAKLITPHTLRHAFITAALDAGVPLRDVQAAASHADPRTTMRYDRARSSLDRHATYIVAAYLAGAAR